MARQNAWERIEAETGKTMHTLLPDLFDKHGRQAKVAEVLGVSQGTVSLWMQKIGMETWTVLRPIKKAGKLKG